MANHRKCECGACKRCEHREYMRAYYWRNRDEMCETARRTRQRNLEEIRRQDRLRGFRPGDREKVQARQSVSNAIARGEMARGRCEVCGSTSTDAHHDDYSKPLSVRWLCRRHHGLLHRKPLPKEA